MKIRIALATASMAMGLVLGCAAAADADVVIPGTGYAGLAGGGNTGTDAFGQPWSWTATQGGLTPGVGAGQGAWGTPGLDAGTVDMYQGSRPATDFEISFVNPNATISQIPSPFPGGLNESTRFDVCTSSCVEWTPVFVSNDQVDFLAPSGTSLTFGEHYFVNVIFNESATQVNGNTTGFTAVFTAPPIPEPGTWAMLILGVAMIGFVARRRSQGMVAFAA